MVVVTNRQGGGGGAGGDKYGEGSVRERLPGSGLRAARVCEVDAVSLGTPDQESYGALRGAGDDVFLGYLAGLIWYGSQAVRL